MARAKGRSVKSRTTAEDMQWDGPACRIDAPAPFCLVIFGASGDLSRRKIYPALYRLFRNRLLPETFAVIGTARTEMNNDTFREMMAGEIASSMPGEFSSDTWQAFAGHLSYITIDYLTTATYRALREHIVATEKSSYVFGKRIFYLSIPPAVYEPVILNLGTAGLSRDAHVVIEKPFGHDLDSARSLSNALKKSFEEEKIYRMDHYLAKETVQSILMFRFANSIFEPLWNRRYIDHVQITVAETLGVEHRAGYYERAGILRDMFQNHLFHLVALTAMEPPVLFKPERVRDERVKVFQAVRPIPLDRLDSYVVLGQYGEGIIGGTPVVSYRDEPGVSPESVMPTYAAMKVYIDNWRWSGVPFYLRSGKRLAERKAEISIQFRPVPHMVFADTTLEGIEPNTLLLRLQPDEGISISFQTKNPGTKVCLRPVEMDFSYQKGIHQLTDYERVLVDCMQGDQMLFVREDSLDLTWRLLTPVIQTLEKETQPGAFPNYRSGSDGPDEARRLIGQEGREWRGL